MNNNGLTHLKTWLFKNKCFVKRGQDKEYTHLLLDGGKLHIPRELYTSFYNVLSMDICQGNRNCISENRTEIFRFLADIDYIDEQPLNDDDIEIIAKKIQTGLELFLRNDSKSSFFPEISIPLILPSILSMYDSFLFAVLISNSRSLIFLSLFSFPELHSINVNSCGAYSGFKKISESNLTQRQIGLFPF